MRQTSVEQIDRLRAAMSGLEAAALAEQMQLQRIEFALEKAARDARYAEADRVARERRDRDGARGVTRPVGAIRPVLRKYIILPRAIFIVVFSHTSERTGCLVLAPRSPRPESPSASRRDGNLRPHPAGAVFRPIRASAARRDLGLSPPLARGWNTSGHTPGHARPRHPRSPDVPAARAEEPSEPASEPALGPLRTRLLRRSPETRACHPRDRTRPRPRRPGRDRTRPP